MKNSSHLPIFGVGPIYVAIMAALTVAGCLLSSHELLPSGNIAFADGFFHALSVISIVGGIILWFRGAIASKLVKNIKENRLVTAGAYQNCRNPLYSGLTLICLGAILWQHNVWLFVLPPIFWLFMTILMKHTEEKWLLEKYGQDYSDYCQKVNRVIPWFKRRLVGLKILCVVLLALFVGVSVCAAVRQAQGKTSVRYVLTEKLFRLAVKPMMVEMADSEKAQEMLAKPQKVGVPEKAMKKLVDFAEGSALGGVLDSSFAKNQTVFYSFAPKGEKTEKAVLYFFGGGFFMPPDSGDFEFCAEMARETKSEVRLVMYPIFPATTQKEIVDSALSVYRDTLSKYEAKNVSLFGLSSGASLSLIMCAAINEENLNLPMSGKLIPFSPTVQLPPTEAQAKMMKEKDALDPMIPGDFPSISVDFMQNVLKTEFYEPFMNAILCSWKNFPEIHLFYGENEVLSAYESDIRKKCAADSVPLTVTIGKGMMHTWAAAGFLPEAKRTRAEIYGVLKKSK